MTILSQDGRGDAVGAVRLLAKSVRSLVDGSTSSFGTTSVDNLHRFLDTYRTGGLPRLDAPSSLFGLRNGRQLEQAIDRTMDGIAPASDRRAAAEQMMTSLVYLVRSDDEDAVKDDAARDRLRQFLTALIDELSPQPSRKAA